MTTKVGLRPVLLFLMLVPLHLPAMDGTAAIENEALRVEVSQETGAIISIFDKHTNTEYTKQRPRARLFQLLLPKPGNLARQINSWEQKPVSVEVADDVLTAKFQKLQVAQRAYLFQAGELSTPAPQLLITVTVTFRLQNEHILASIEVENRSLELITDVVFPLLDGLPDASEGHPFKVTLPSLSQKRITAAGDFLFGERAKSYPALLATSWLDYENGSKGIGIEVQSAPETQEALVSLTPNVPVGGDAAEGPGSPYIGWNFYPHIGGQSKWKSPPVVIHVHAADWHSIAAEHREWYRQQHSPKPVTAFDQAVGFSTYRLKKDDNTVNWRYDQLPNLADASAKAGIRDLVIDGWRAREGPGNPSPFGEVADPRMGGASSLKDVVGKLEQGQVNLLFAFHPAYINTATDRYKKEAIRWTVRTRRQVEQMQPQFTFYTFDYPYEEEIAHFWGVVDPSLPVTEQLLHDAQRLKQDYGFRNLFLRGVGLQSYLSYNKEDVAAPQKVYEVGYERFLGGLQKLYPGGMLLMEGFNDLVNPYGDGGYTWVQNTDAEVLAYSIPWTPFSNDVDALDFDQVNLSFARKILVNLLIDGGDGTVERYPRFAEHLKLLQSLKKATGPYYAQAEFRDRDGLKKVDADNQVVVSSFYNAPDRKRGIVVANLAEQKKKAALELDLQSTAKGHLFRLDGSEQEIQLPQFSLDLAPYEVVVLTVDSVP
ncbi:MAG TPA: hypothetical protein VMU26_19935 [Candidatus Polarisedimenticolia bacterium]|nr:hypothetical protein [Candidatus Polarisedimenticolia bacterium]